MRSLNLLSYSTDDHHTATTIPQNTHVQPVVRHNSARIPRIGVPAPPYHVGNGRVRAVVGLHVGREIIEHFNVERVGEA